MIRPMPARGGYPRSAGMRSWSRPMEDTAGARRCSASSAEWNRPEEESWDAPVTGEARTRRILVYRLSSTGWYELSRQLGYQVEPGQRISEVAAYGEDGLLVLEASFTAGVGNRNALYSVPAAGRGADVTTVPDLRRSRSVRWWVSGSSRTSPPAPPWAPRSTRCWTTTKHSRSTPGGPGAARRSSTCSATTTSVPPR
ncbi:hypothetical protein E0504_30695 [Parafrankia sp. BMG5.11]|nr:hypothetical protein E0504_30695 [Parafrankia sp. BMG5.11]